MKLNSHIAKYIRRCGYAAALTLASGAVFGTAEAKTYTTITSYLQDAEGKLVYDAEGNPVSDTTSLREAIESGDLHLRDWCTQRPAQKHDYQFLVWDVDDPSYENNVVTVDHAIRPIIQQALTESHLEREENVTKLSYIAARSTAPSEALFTAAFDKTNNYGCSGGIYGTGDTGIGTTSQEEWRNFEIIEPTTTPINVSHNKLSITSSGFHSAIGAYTQYGNATYNDVYIQDARFSDDIYGGSTFEGAADEASGVTGASMNTVTIFRAVCIAGKKNEQLGYYDYNNSGRVAGGWTTVSGSAYNDASGNKVFLYGSYVFLEVVGGTGSSDAINNEVFISKSHIGEGLGTEHYKDVDDTIGGRSFGNYDYTKTEYIAGTASNNSVIIDDTYDTYGYVPEMVQDGTQAGEWDAAVPDVSIVYTNILGGISHCGSGDDGAHNNTVRVIGITSGTGDEAVTTTIVGEICGGHAGNESGYAGITQAASATGNLVEITGADIRSEFIFEGGKTLTDRGTIYGGYVGAPANDNINPGNANENVVAVSDSTVANNIYGGWNGSEEHIVKEDETTYGDASHNRLYFDNLSTNGKDLTFYGGWSEGGNTNYNNVYLRNPGWSMSNTYLHGGWGNTGYTLDSAEDYQTNTKQNWLHVQGFQGEIKGFDHFEEVHFVVTPEVNRNTPMIIFTGDTDNKEEATSMVIYTNPESGESKLVHVTADISAIADQLKPGDVIPLFGHANNAIVIDGTSDIDKDSVVDDNVQHRRGVTRTVTLDTEFYEVNEEADKLSDEDKTKFKNDGVIKVLGKTEEVTPESKALVEGRIATLTLNNLGGNLVAEQGIDSAARIFDNPADHNVYVPVDQGGKGAYVPKSELEPGKRLFFVMSGGHTKEDSGSHVNVDGVNALVGIAQGLLKQDALTLGAFMETGWGQYTTHSYFSTIPEVRGTGETSYVGAGALMRYRLDNVAKKLKGFALDASVRAGSQETDFASFDLRDDYGTVAEYELDSTYIAGHVGLNYTFQPTDKVAATVYARYLWTRIESDDAAICSERVTFEDMDSNRLRFGTRATWQLNANWQPYAGLACEWEMSGTARAVTHGMGITAPSMHGGTVIGEIGTVWQPNETRPLWLEFAAQGTLGKQEGYAGKVGVSIGF